MPVLELVKYRNRESVDVLHSLLDLTADGPLDLMICYRPATGGVDVAFTGRYRHSPAEALRVALALSMRLTELERLGPGPA